MTTSPRTFRSINEHVAQIRRAAMIDEAVRMARLAPALPRHIVDVADRFGVQAAESAYHYTVTQIREQYHALRKKRAK